MERWDPARKGRESKSKTNNLELMTDCRYCWRRPELDTVMLYGGFAQSA